MIVVSRVIDMLDLALVVIGLDFEEGGASRSPRLGRASIGVASVKPATKYNGIAVQYKRARATEARAIVTRERHYRLARARIRDARRTAPHAELCFAFCVSTVWFPVSYLHRPTPAPACALSCPALKLYSRYARSLRAHRLPRTPLAAHARSRRAARRVMFSI